MRRTVNVSDGEAKPRKRSWRKRLLGTIIYGVFLLVFVELALQTFYYVSVGDFLFTRMALPIYAPDEHAGIWNKPNLDQFHKTREFRAQLYTNAQGFRVPSPGIEYDLEKDPAKYRVMLMGPSFAYGHAVNYEDSFAARLEESLERQGFADARDVELINAGVPALANLNQLRWYEGEGREYAPDLLLQFVYGSMAIPPTEPQEVTDDGYLVRKGGLKKALMSRAKNSAIIFYGWTLWMRAGDLLHEEPETGEIAGAGRAMQVRSSFDPDDPATVESMKYYERLREAAAADGARLVLVHFPLSYCIHRGDISRWKHLGVRDVDQQIAYEEAFCAYLRDRGFECLNITPDLQAAAETGERLYYWLDIHWTPRGNLVAAEAVAARLLGEGDS